MEQNNFTFCPHCGRQLEAGTQFCPACGKPINARVAPAAAKDKITTGILAIVLSGLGIHYFYLGKTTAGILTILLSMVSCGLWAFVMFVQGILILTMSEELFQEKYVNTPKSFPLF